MLKSPNTRKALQALMDAQDQRLPMLEFRQALGIQNRGWRLVYDRMKKEGLIAIKGGGSFDYVCLTDAGRSVLERSPSVDDARSVGPKA